MANKVKFGLRNVHYAKLTANDDGTPVFGDFKPWIGAVSMSLDAQGDNTPFYADDTVFYTATANNGYEGDFESSLVPEDFRQNIMGEYVDDNNVQIENAEAEPSSFALAFEFQGNQKPVRYLLYNCKMTRAAINGQTKEDSTEPQTDSVTITAIPLTGLIEGKTITKVKTTEQTASDVYANWYKTVYIPPNSTTPLLLPLTVVSVKGSATGETKITVTPPLSVGNHYVYQLGTGLTLPLYGADVSAWTPWDGTADILATTGDDLVVVETDTTDKALKAGIVTVVSK